VSRYRILFASAAAVLTDSAMHGEGLIAHEIMRRLVERGHEVIAVGRESSFAADPAYEVIAVGEQTLLESLQPAAYARAVASLTGQLRRDRHIDVVHWLYPDSDDDLVYRPAGDVPFVIGPLNARWPPASLPLRRPALGDVLSRAIAPVVSARRKQVLASADRVLVALPEVEDRVSGASGCRVDVVPLGLDETLYSVEPLPARPVVGYVGRLSPEKGVETLLAAWPSVTAALDADLLIAGDGPLRPTVESAVQVGRNVHYLGRVPHEEIGPVISGASLVCNPSVKEPYGMSVLETMACGRAVVASNAGGPRFMIEHGTSGLLVPPLDASALSTALTTLLGSRSHLAAMGEAGRARLESTFTLDGMVTTLERVYDDVTRGP
jgi:glycosyltransferase involved in cell wall biosynthesis